MLNADSYLLVGAAVYLQIGIRLDGRRSKAVVLPPGGEGRGHGEARGHQLFQLAVLNGQHRLAGGRQQLIGQGQGQTGGAGDGANEISFMVCSFLCKGSFFAAGAYRQAFAFMDNVGDGGVSIPQGHIGVVAAAQGLQAIRRDGALVDVVEAQVQNFGPQQALDAVFQGLTLFSFPAEVADGVAHCGAYHGAHHGHHHAGQDAGQRGQKNLFHRHHPRSCVRPARAMMAG